MSCPYTRKRFIGSGYVKESSVEKTQQAKELDDRVAKLLADREKQDTHYFPVESIQPKPVAQSSVQNDKTPPKTF